MKIPFVKMQGLGNDFVLLDNRKGRIRNFRGLARRLCDRRFGIGADQLLVLSASDRADFRMRIFNADGSEVEMCGNGIRCLAKHIWDTGLKNATPLEIETSAGIIRPEKAGSLVRVDMGKPVFEAGKIPLNLRVLRAHRSRISSPVTGYPLRIRGKTYQISCVSMGNPHAVIVHPDIESVDLSSVGPAIERHRLFPKRTNVEFIQVISRKKIMMRVWERGAGETLACGTGASAAAVASSLLGFTDRTVRVHIRGGILSITWSPETNHVFMTGPAETVFTGTIEA